MSNFNAIVGYTFEAEQYTPNGLIEALIQSGFASPFARTMGAEEFLDQWANGEGIDREDEHSFDSDDFPKVVFSYQLEGNPETDMFRTELDTYELMF